MSIKCFKDNNASPQLIKRYEDFLASGLSETEAGRAAVAERYEQLAEQVNGLRASLQLPVAARPTKESVYADVLALRDTMEGTTKALISDEYNADVMDFLISGALDNRNQIDEMFKDKTIADKLLQLATPADTVAAAAAKKELLRAEPNVPAPIADFEVTEVIEYTDPDLNNFKPSQQRKFNQGTFEAVWVVGNSELMELIGFGAKIKSMFSGKSVKIDDVRRKELEKKYNISAAEAHSRATNLAKQNRTKINERIILIGKNDGITRVSTENRAANTAPITGAKEDNGIKIKYNLGRAPDADSGVAKKVKVKALTPSKVSTPMTAVVRKAPRLTVPANEIPTSNQQAVFDIVKAAFPAQLEKVNLTDFINASGLRSDDGKYYYLGNDTHLNYNQRTSIPRDLIFVPQESIDQKVDELKNACDA